MGNVINKTTNSYDGFIGKIQRKVSITEHIIISSLFLFWHVKSCALSTHQSNCSKLVGRLLVHFFNNLTIPYEVLASMLIG